MAGKGEFPTRVCPTFGLMTAKPTSPEAQVDNRTYALSYVSTSTFNLSASSSMSRVQLNFRDWYLIALVRFPSADARSFRIALENSGTAGCLARGFGFMTKFHCRRE
jgi:hypothetical protein